jgi:hypothetical protein
LAKGLNIDFDAEVIHWRGPAPFYFLKIPVEFALSIKEISKTASYGWGVIPTTATIGTVEFYTALIPKDDSYLLPLKKAVREELKIDLGQQVEASLHINSEL